MGWVGYVARTKQMRNVQKLLFGKLSGKTST